MVVDRLPRLGKRELICLLLFTCNYGLNSIYLIMNIHVDIHTMLCETGSGSKHKAYIEAISCNYVVSVWRGFLFLWVPGMGYVILLWHSLSLPYNYFAYFFIKTYVMGAHYNRLAEAILMSTHNIGFYEDLTKIIFELSSNIIKYAPYSADGMIPPNLNEPDLIGAV